MLQLARNIPKISSAYSLNLARNMTRSNVASRWALSRPVEPIGLMAGNLMRDLENELDLVRNQMNKRFNLLEEGNIWNDFGMNMFMEPLRIIPNNIVTDSEGNRSFKMILNLKEFKPEEIKVKTKGKNLIISAKTEKDNENEYYLREFSQSYSLPKDLKLEELESKVLDDGMLVINAPLPKLSESSEIKERPLKIEHEQTKKLN